MDQERRQYAVERVQQQITDALATALSKAVAAGDLPPGVKEAVTALEVPRDRGHGDYAANVAMTLARTARRNPRQIAEIIVAACDFNGTAVESAEVAGPGFINFFLHDAWLHRVVGDVLESGQAYGNTAGGEGVRVLVEFVSANPTGPLNVVNARHAALGDVLANLLQAAGYTVEREFYVNDAGNQFRMLGIAMDV
ncbi:MAG: arginine--tRNA ligase, partial [Thermaerobacterales bacterium]